MRAVARRRGLGLLVVLLVVGVVAAVAVVVVEGDGEERTDRPAGPSTVPRPTYANPVGPEGARNPTVTRTAEGTYVAYADGTDTIEAYRSEDLATWSPLGPVLVTPGASSPGVRAGVDGRTVMYVTRWKPGGEPCIEVATADDPEGPFAVAPEPLVCSSGAAWAPSPVPGRDQIVYLAEQPVPGVYGLALAEGGTAVAPGAEPVLLLAAEGGAMREDVLRRPAVARDGDRAYLFVGTGAAGVGWSPCVTRGGLLETCAHRRQLGTWVDEVDGLQAFTGADGAWWIVYDGDDGMALDKLCFAPDAPRTNAPSTGDQTVARVEDCSHDVPGAELARADVDDDERVDQPWDISLREVGGTVPVGGRLLWLFRDTYLDAVAVGDGPCAEQGASRSSTAGLGVPHPFAEHRGYLSPLATFGPDLTCSGQYLPLTREEELFTRSRADLGERRVLWEDGGIPLDDGSALVFFTKGFHNRDADGSDGPDTGCAICLDYRGEGVVRVEPGATLLDRTSTPVGCLDRCLFDVEDGWSGRPFRAGDFVYSYSATPDTTTLEVRLGRAPLDRVTDRWAWEFRTDDGHWSPDVADAGVIDGLIDLPSTVAYNGHLDRYVTVVSPVDDDQVSIQTAPEPWGPWSAPTEVYDWSDVECDRAKSERPVLVPWLDDDGGRILRFAFTRAGPDFGRDPACPGQVRLVTVTLE